MKNERLNKYNGITFRFFAKNGLWVCEWLSIDGVGETMDLAFADFEKQYNRLDK